MVIDNEEYGNNAEDLHIKYPFIILNKCFFYHDQRRLILFKNDSI